MTHVTSQRTAFTQTRNHLEGTIDMGYAELTAPMVASILNLEFLVHAWDFSKAPGRRVVGGR